MDNTAPEATEVIWGILIGMPPRHHTLKIGFKPGRAWLRG